LIAQFKLNVDITTTLVAGTGDILNTWNTINGFFQRLGYLVLNNIGIGAGIGGTYIYIGGSIAG
jgi:hypothetical protein